MLINTVPQAIAFKPSLVEVSRGRVLVSELKHLARCETPLPGDSSTFANQQAWAGAYL